MDLKEDLRLRERAVRAEQQRDELLTVLRGIIVAIKSGDAMDAAYTAHNAICKVEEQINAIRDPAKD